MSRVPLPKLLGRKLAESLLIFPFMIYDNGPCGRRSLLRVLSSFFLLFIVPDIVGGQAGHWIIRRAQTIIA